jgi:ABC-2 type transport system permease protein
MLLAKYRIRMFLNHLKNADRWKIIKNLIFLFTGIFLLTLLYISFLKVLNYLKGVEIIGELLVMKLSAMVFVISFSMIAISSLIIAMTTLFYSRDLNFLFSLALDERYIFIDKVITTSFYSSWSIVVILFPYIAAMMKVSNSGIGILGVFLVCVIPYSFMAAFIGIIISLFLMYFFPSSRTRDIVWIVSSLSFSLVYVGIRFSKPEKLLRPDMMGVIANYLSYLQAPTSKYLPSWWFTKALIDFAHMKYLSSFMNLFLLYFVLIVVFWIMVRVGKNMYLVAYSQSQSSGKKTYKYTFPFEYRLSRKGFLTGIMPLLYKERISVFRDVRYLSQLILIVALSMVYVYSIKSLPVDDFEFKNLISFLNIMVSGFLCAAICLRFVFTSVSYENGCFWIYKTMPLTPQMIILSKLLFYFPFMYLFSLGIVSISSYYLSAEKFMFSFYIFLTTFMSFVISVYAISFGSIFPDFRIENIHQVESSYGGFIFMASSLFYVIFVIAIFAYPIRQYFICFGNKNLHFDWYYFYFSLAMFMILSFATSFLVFNIAKRSIQSIEI